MSINEIIVYLMVVFMALGAFDRILGNRFGLGEKFVGSLIESTMVLSTSVFSPTIINATSLFNSLFMSLTIRFIF